MQALVHFHQACMRFLHKGNEKAWGACNSSVGRVLCSVEVMILPGPMDFPPIKQQHTNQLSQTVNWSQQVRRTFRSLPSH